EQQVVKKFIAGLVQSWKYEGRTARLWFDSPEKAKQARNMIHGKMLPRVKTPIRAEVVQPPAVKVAAPPPAQPSVAPVAAPAHPGTPTAAVQAPAAIAVAPAADEPAPGIVLPPGKPPNPFDGRGQRRPAPYHFVPVETKAAVTDGPVYHDKFNGEGYWTGELR